MKRTPLKKVSPTERKKRERKLDKDYQDFFREVCRQGNIPCEVCGKPMNLVHHFVEKSQCINLRYMALNLVPLCSGCHFKLHMVGDYTGIAKITLKRGKGWFKKIQDIRKLVGHKDKSTYDKAELQLNKWKSGSFYLMDFVEKYKKHNYF